MKEGQQAEWTKTVLNPWMLSLGSMAAVATLVVGLSASWAIAIAPLALAAVLVGFGTIRVSLDDAHLQIQYGVARWPASFISIDEIETATAIDVRPMRWGGWGYRGSLKLMKRAAVVVRGGPGVQLELTGGRVFVVTVDDPETPVALLSAAIGRRT